MAAATTCQHWGILFWVFILTSVIAARRNRLESHAWLAFSSSYCIPHSLDFFL
ncbi:hypothetical protein BCR42DRAFT_409665 [Absidia repens]|uniref:Uncharacterized protein n=1 Tax=Absidia repens TaxID=90262 RepID=A0A1X2IMY7_9FUNG|nr:hypothetical protein BCR42DRAFT_409665 [Absidia repens]